MTNPLAVLVEDDPQQSEVSQDVLTSARFEVQSFDAIAPALEFVRSTPKLIDLFVLDRRLPVNVGEPASDELGDELLREVRSTFSDARLIVFTGFASIRHVQDTLRGSSLLPFQGGQPIDRISVLEKDQSLEFKQHVEEFRRLLQSLDDIEIVALSGNALQSFDKRALRRLAFEYRAISISVAPLGGGLTDASVWKCELSRPEGHVATVVAKRVKTASARGGLPELLPRVSTTSRLATVSGLMAGSTLNVLQVAGDAPSDLMQIILAEPTHAVDLARTVWGALNGVTDHQKTIPIEEVCAPIIDWAELQELLRPHDIQVPPGSLTATIRFGLRHGDLHPGNVLIDNNQAVLIDFDSNTFAAGALDPITMLISTLVHPDSPIRGAAWPGESEISTSFGTDNFGSGHPCEPWFRGTLSWAKEGQASEREFWALVLAYATRQLRYEDVLADVGVVERIVAIAKRAAQALFDS